MPEQLQGSGAKISIAPKSALILRGLDLIKSFPDARAAWSINTLGGTFRANMDKAVSIRRAKAQCNLIWLEILNPRGGYKAVIMDCIQEKHSDPLPLYQEIYNKNDRRYWELLDGDLKARAAEIGPNHVTNDGSMNRPFEAPPIIVNFFYHSEIKRSAARRFEKSVATVSKQ